MRTIVAAATILAILASSSVAGAEEVYRDGDRSLNVGLWAQEIFHIGALSLTDCPSASA